MREKFVIITETVLPAILCFLLYDTTTKTHLMKLLQSGALKFKLPIITHSVRRKRELEEMTSQRFLRVSKELRMGLV